mmetsp:Transcript_2826/g.9498  ORF Transcript_2826/g.9498 Transcript_2826/m.9498 type:complete len:93 (+) Transcript_2826:2040-2318(+)
MSVCTRYRFQVCSDPHSREKFFALHKDTSATVERSSRVSPSPEAFLPPADASFPPLDFKMAFSSSNSSVCCARDTVHGLVGAPAKKLSVCTC